MRKIILLLLIIFGSAPSWGSTELVQTIVTLAEGDVQITNQPSVNTATINPLTGVLSNKLTAIYKVDTNVSSSHDFAFIMQVKVNTQAGLQNALANTASGASIILGNIDPLHHPTLAAVNNLKTIPTSPLANANAISYPITATTTFPSVAIANLSTYGGLCFQLNVGLVQTGTISAAVATSAVPNSYSFTNDLAGTYQATVIMSAYSL